MTRLFFITLISIGLITSGMAQGLLGIGHYGSESTEASPLRLTLGVQGGYDSNTSTSASEPNSSYFSGAGLGAYYAMATSTSRLDIGGNLSALWYEDPGPVGDEIFYNTRLSANATHQFSERFRLTNNSMVSYEIEPDYLIGASSALRDDQYLYWFNRTALWYSLSAKLTSVSSYGIQGINYEDNLLSQREDRLTHTFSQQLRRGLTERTSARVEYRFSVTDYNSIDYDSKSHFFLAGLDHQFTEDTLGTIVAGAEVREYDRFDEKDTAPYVEAAVNHRISNQTSVRWLGRAGLENNEVFGFRDRYSYRTGLTATHKVTDSLRFTSGLSYVHSEFGADEFDGMDEDAISAQVGVGYSLYENVELNAGYYYTTYSSADSGRDYDRSRVNVGVSTAF